VISFEDLERLRNLNSELASKFTMLLATVSIKKLRAMTQPNGTTAGKKNVHDMRHEKEVNRYQQSNKIRKIFYNKYDCKFICVFIVYLSYFFFCILFRVYL
jgi:hypothetical protein